MAAGLRDTAGTTSSGGADRQGAGGARRVVPPRTAADLLLQLQRGAGNAAVGRLLQAHGGGPSIQRLFTVMPSAHVGNDAATAPALLAEYVKTLPVSDQAATPTFPEEGARIAAALEAHQPSKAATLKADFRAIRASDPVAKAALLNTWVIGANSLVASFLLDQPRTTVAGQAQEALKHHWRYEFGVGGAQSTGFDLDEWSRKTEASAASPSLGVTVKGIVDEVVAGWDTAGAIVPLLVSRLLSPTAEVPGQSTVAPLLSGSALGQRYLKVLLSAKHILGIRTRDLGPRDVRYQKWRQGSSERETLSADIDWTRLLKLARAALKPNLVGGVIADQAATRTLIIAAVLADPEVQKLTGPGMLNADAGAGKWALNDKPHRVGTDLYQAMGNDRFDFDMSHAKAIIYFDWRAVYDLTR